MDRYYYEQDWVSDPPLRAIYRKYKLVPTGREIPYTDFSPGGDDYIQEFERKNVKRISKEEYENRGEA